MIPAFVRTRAFLVVALLVSAGLAGGSAVALVNAGDSGGPITTAGPAPTTSPPTSATPEPTATPEQTASPTASATATPTAATPTATPKATATPSASATAATTYSYPPPTRSYAPLVLSATLDPGDGTTGNAYAITLKATDGDGTIYFDGIDWGDGTSTAAAANPQRCGRFPTPTRQPAAYQPQRDSYERTSANAFRHTYGQSRAYDVVVRVSSVNVDCRPHGPSNETATAAFHDVLVQTPASASPSPAATP